MANGKKGGGDGGLWDTKGPDSHGKSIDGVAESYDKLRNAKNQAANAATPDLKHLQNFEDLSEDTAKAQESLAQQIKRSTQEIVAQAKEIGSLRSQIDDVTGAIKGFGQDLKKTASITHQYSLAMKEFKQGTEAYTQSLSLSTAKLGQASAETTKFMKATQHAYNEAYTVAKLYGIEVDEVRQQMDKLQTTFASQLSATSNQGKALTQLTKEAMMFARTTGVDTAEAIQRMDERMRASNMTMEEARQEQMLVMKEIDNYKTKLQALGKEVMKTGNITSKDLVKALQQVRQEFKGGAYDAGTFAKAFTSITLKGKSMGLTTEQITGTMTGFSKVMQSFSKQSGYVGMTGSMEMLEKFGQMKGPIGKLARHQQKLVAQGTSTNLQAGEAILEGSAGSPEAMMLLAKIAKETIPSAVRGHYLQESTGSALQASVVNEMLESGSYKSIFEKQSKMTKEEKEKEANAFKTPMEKLLVEAHTAQSTRHKTAKTLDDFKKMMQKWTEKYWYMMLAIQAGGSILNRVGGGGAAGVAGRGAGGVRGAMKMGGTVLALAATAKGLHSAFKSYQKGDTRGAIGQAALAPFVGGYQMGMAGEKAIGGQIAKGMSKEFQNTLGKDKSLTNIISSSALDNPRAQKAFRVATAVLTMGASEVFRFGAKKAAGLSGDQASTNKRGWEMIKKERIGLDWEAFGQAKDLYKLREKEIKALEAKQKKDGYLSKKEQELLDKKNEEIRLMEKKVAGLKRAIDEEKKIAKKGPLKYKYDHAKSIRDIGHEFSTEKINKEDIQTAGDVKYTIKAVIRSLQSGGKYDALTGGRESLERAASLGRWGGKGTANIKKLMSIAQSRGVSNEEFFQIWEKETSGYASNPGGSFRRAPIVAPREETDKLKKGGQVSLNVNLGSDDSGNTGEKKIKTNPDGSVEETTTITTSQKVTVKVPSQDVKSQAFHNKKMRMREQGNKQARN